MRVPKAKANGLGRKDYWSLENSIGYLARVAFRSFSSLLERRTLEYDVSAGQWRFLRQLWRGDGITQRELSARVGMREPTTVVTLKGLEKAGLVYRETSEVDRRKIHVFLTPRAKELEAILTPMSTEVHEMATRGFSDEEIDTLRSLLRRVIDNLAEEAEKVDIKGNIAA